MPRLSKWTVEALMLSDDLAKLIESNRLAEEKERTDMAIVTAGSGAAPVIDDDTYEITCIDVSDPFEEMDFNGTKKIQKIKVFIQVHGTDDGEGNEVVLDPKVNLKWWDGGPKKTNPSTLYTYATAFCGPQDVDFPFDTDNLKGKKASAYIETLAEGDWPRIAKFVASKRAARPPLKEALADAAAQVSAEVADKGLSDFWAATRKAGVTLDDVKLSSNDMFGKTPAELTPDERTQLLEALQVPF